VIIGQLIVHLLVMVQNNCLATYMADCSTRLEDSLLFKKLGCTGF